MLELEDIEEEEELEGLEGGVVPEEEVDGALEGEEGESPPPPKGEEPVLSCSRHKYVFQLLEAPPTLPKTLHTFLFLQV